MENEKFYKGSVIHKKRIFDIQIDTQLLLIEC